MARIYTLCILTSIVLGVWLDTISQESIMDFSDLNKVSQRRNREESADGGQFQE
ncbi:hypothetical protein SAMN04489841_0229 [Natrinema salaciae]|uniref:Uncharacterized protein n=1 Tax=Natrinema salaciae TaxID=1186196 RepID=A0A1H8ZPS6_9EURY|nr:hypothetical protein SAMN04489841_0229 [Natrinema salaciae]